MEDAPVIERPHLTMPEAEARALRAAYVTAGVILEYGSGGSTVMAAEMPGKTLFAVESDAEWLGKMQRYFATFPPLGTVILHHGDVGPTQSWGRPRSDAGFRQWPGYALSVWDRGDFQHPDVVLVDGRFRAACFLTALFRIRRPVTLLWDDYSDRPAYHEVEALVKPVEMIGRMARFNLVPTPVPAERLGWILETYLRPQ